MNIRPLFIAALLAAPGGILAQAPQAAPAKESTAKHDVKTPPAAGIDPNVIAALRTAFAAQRNKGSYRALLETSIGGTVLPSLEIEAVYPDRIRLKRSGMEVVFVAGKGMVKKEDKWTPAPAAIAKSLGAIDDPQEDEKLLGSAIETRSLGQVKTDGRLTDCYEIQSKGKTGPTKSKFFISLEDSLIRRVETRADFQGKAVISTMVVGDYGIPIQIELPK